MRTSPKLLFFKFYGKLFLLLVSYFFAYVAFFLKKKLGSATNAGEPNYSVVRHTIIKQLESQLGLEVSSIADLKRISFPCDTQVIVFKAPVSSGVDELVVHFKFNDREDKKVLLFESARIKSISFKNRDVSKQEVLQLLKKFSDIVLLNTNFSDFKRTLAFSYPFIDYQISRLILLFVFLSKNFTDLFNDAKNRIVDLELGEVLFNWDCFDTKYSLTLLEKKYVLSHTGSEGARAEFVAQFAIDECSMYTEDLYSFVVQRVHGYESY